MREKYDFSKSMKNPYLKKAPTIRRGRELTIASGAYAKLRRLKGKIEFHIKLSKLRKDRPAG